ncbi:uncharacterized protein LOC136078492 [Hydra vulgaris]|uniref:Uncharacterized protein LOC136078492 n=1 Tax=Hydra vulgaris TaxID=6087 RepID=A0ABM4BMR8_HYDVU
MVKFARRNYKEKLARKTESNPKRLHVHVQSKQSDTGDICLLLNNCSHLVFVLEPDGPMPAFESCTEAICVVDPASFSINIVQKYLNHLDERKSTGYDGLYPRVFSKCEATFVKSLSLINKCLFGTGVVYDLWRKLNVTSIFNKGSKLNASNYRTILLTSISYKMIESIFQTSIMEHCVAYGLITPKQHGFVQGCVSNLLETRDIMTEVIHRSHTIEVIYIDFVKAFEKMPHKHLLNELRVYGV